MLSISSISKKIRKTNILNNFTLPPIYEGEIVTILGKNGAGKSTFLKELIDLIGKKKPVAKINSSVVSYDDVGYLPQNYSIPLSVTVLDLLITTLNLHNKSLLTKKNSLEHSIKILKQIDITHLANKYCNQLSGGESQLVGLALALINNPKIIILDEPTSALDLNNQLLLMHFVHDYIKKHNIYGLMVVHDINLAIQFSDKVAIIKNGELYDYGNLNIIDPALIKNVFDVNSKIIVTEKKPILFTYK
ncbi:ABC transporter ATP-binding protein [Paraphotobacterium marinum]|uniref:ABC transporter ATP-binding protein n=1 Tax=Paraphotobacterium marinum TaxID=1755811 RepID=UPI0039E75698